MLRTAMGPATSWLEDPAIDAQTASAAKLLIESDISLPGLVRILACAADLQINGGAA
jgi:hypothetical protein